jgi:diguanylate cyclase (GGDEF)-like protein/PAS domain S-box-containing protein
VSSDGVFVPVPLAGAREALRRCWPFVAVGVGSVGLESVTGGSLDRPWWHAGIGVAVVGLVIAVLAESGRVRVWWETAGGIVCLVGVGLARHGTGGIGGGYGSLVLLPIVWFSLYGTRRQLGVMIGCAAVVLAGPIAVINGDRYPSTGWRSTLVLLGVGGLWGVTSQTLRDRLAAKTVEQEAVAAQVRDALESMADPIGRYEVIRDATGQPVDLCCVLLNASGRDMLGADTIGELLSERLQQRGRYEMLDVWLSAVDAAEPVRYELASKRWQQGRTVMLQLVSIHDGVLATWRDVTDERAAETNLRQSIERWHSVADTAADASLVLDKAFHVIHVSASIAELLGLQTADAIGRQALEMVHPDDRTDVASILRSALDDDDRHVIEFRVLNLREPEHSIWLEGRVTGLNVSDDRELNIGLRDVTAAHLERDLLGHQATHDPLTGLLNRAGLQTHLETHAAAHSRRQLLYLDLDRFKPINDTYGHAAGDEVLIETARRIVDTIRADDAAARIGGDEFAIISHTTGPAHEAQHIADRLRMRIAAPITLLNGSTVHITASIGCAAAPALATVDELLLAADHEMYRAKRQRQHLSQGVEN